MVFDKASNYFSSLNLETTSADKIVDKVAKEHPEYLKFLLEFFKDKDKIINPEITQKIFQEIDKNKSILERLPPEMKVQVFSFLDPENLASVAQTAIDLRDIADDQKINWINQNEGKIFDLGLSNEVLIKLLSKYGERIKILHIKDKQKDEDAAVIHGLIKHCPNLSTLFIQNSKIKVEDLAPELGKLARLQQLDLRGNQIGDAGTKDLAPELGKLARLQQLYLRDNQIGDAGAKDLATQLQQPDLALQIHIRGRVRLF